MERKIGSCVLCAGGSVRVDAGPKICVGRGNATEAAFYGVWSSADEQACGTDLPGSISRHLSARGKGGTAGLQQDSKYRIAAGFLSSREFDSGSACRRNTRWFMAER